MFPCIFFFAEELSAKDDNELDMEVAEKEEYGYIAILIALIAPLSITLKNYFTKTDLRNYKMRELAIDQMLF